MAAATTQLLTRLLKKYYNEELIREMYERKMEDFIQEQRRAFGQWDENEFGIECP